MARLMFLVLFGKPRGDLHAHESPKTMTIPLMILAFFAVFVGFIGSPFMRHTFQKFIFFNNGHEAGQMRPDYFVMGLSTIVSLLGIGLAYLFYIRNNKILSATARAKFGGLYSLLSNKYYIDEIYETIFVRPCLRACAFLFKFDVLIIDGIVNTVARIVQLCSVILLPVQTGLIQNYVLIQIIGVVIFILFFLKKL